jgi:hypothetical protein
MQLTEFKKVENRYVTDEGMEVWTNEDDINRQWRQLIRKYKDGTWVLEIICNFNTIKLPLREKEAKMLLNGAVTGSFGYIDAVVVDSGENKHLLDN